MENKFEAICAEVNKVILGKEEVVKKILMALVANGHVLLDDVPGVGKTTLAMAFARATGLNYCRIQCTPDVMPSDIVGFSMYRQQTDSFTYMPGAINDANLVLADEINRTSSKTQSALLEAMEEHQVTVDGTVHPLPKPFLVIATENQVGTAGTQLLPQAQLDRFLVKLTIGYPQVEQEIEILRGRRKHDPLNDVEQVANVYELLHLQHLVGEVTLKEEMLAYITNLAARSRSHQMISLGISPRGTLALSRMARACALAQNRDYVVPEDVAAIFEDVCAHRLLLSQKARSERLESTAVLRQILPETPLPYRQK